MRAAKMGGTTIGARVIVRAKGPLRPTRSKVTVTAVRAGPRIMETTCSEVMPPVGGSFTRTIRSDPQALRGAAGDDLPDEEASVLGQHDHPHTGEARLLALPGDPLTILLRGEKSGVGIVERISDRDDRAIGELPRRDFARGGGEGRVERGTEDPVRLDRGCPGSERRDLRRHAGGAQARLDSIQRHVEEPHALHQRLIDVLLIQHLDRFQHQAGVGVGRPRGRRQSGDCITVKTKYSGIYSPTDIFWYSRYSRS